MNFTVDHAISWMQKTNDMIQENKEYLTKLDQAIGDGDHGINMARGFKEVAGKLSDTEYSTVADVMKDTAMTLMSKVGGASGPLYGTAFLKLSLTWKDKADINDALFIAGLQEALQGVKGRGKAQAGEKTLVDVWQTVVDQLEKNGNLSPEIIKDTAEKALHSTKDIMATKGRAAYLRERSIGHLDPGATSSFYLFNTLAAILEGKE